jgi:hypothetical protein
MQVIAEDIQKELSLNGLKKLPALPQRYYCSPLSFVPKTAEGKQTGRRRIFDLFPKNQSINDHIAKEFGYLQYETFDEAIAAIANTGQNAILLKRNLKSVFHMINTSLYGRPVAIIYYIFCRERHLYVFSVFFDCCHWRCGIV